jgi:hypothetical protein
MQRVSFVNGFSHLFGGRQDRKRSAQRSAPGCWCRLTISPRASSTSAEPRRGKGGGYLSSGPARGLLRADRVIRHWWALCCGDRARSCSCHNRWGDPPRRTHEVGDPLDSSGVRPSQSLRDKIVRNPLTQTLNTREAKSIAIMTSVAAMPSGRGSCERRRRHTPHRELRGKSLYTGIDAKAPGAFDAAGQSGEEVLDKSIEC